MRIIAYRSTTPFDNRTDNNNPSISPTTEKSVMPFNNVETIQDIFNNGWPSYKGLHSGGDWASGEDVDKSYKEKGDDYKRMERDLDILDRMQSNKNQHLEEKWKVKVPGGYKIFPSFSMAQRYKEEQISKGNKFTYISRIAQQNITNRAKFIAESMAKCFMVESIDYKAGVKETGSAFCIKPNLFMTCAHVIKKYNKNEIEKYNNEYFLKDAFVNLVKNGQWYKSSIVYINYFQDIAILKSNIVCDSFEIDDSFFIGDEIIVVGSPHGYENNVSEGIIGSADKTVYAYNNAPKYMFVDLSVFPGNSGGPVIKESDGKVVGIVTLIISSSGGYGLNAALPAKYFSQTVKNI